MDFIIEYHVKIIEFFSFEENELNLSDEDISLHAKCAHKVILQNIFYKTKDLR